MNTVSCVLELGSIDTLVKFKEKKIERKQIDF